MLDDDGIAAPGEIIRPNDIYVNKQSPKVKKGPPRTRLTDRSVICFLALLPHTQTHTNIYLSVTLELLCILLTFISIYAVTISLLIKHSKVLKESRLLWIKWLFILTRLIIYA